MLPHCHLDLHSGARLVIQPKRHIIKHSSLSSLRIDDSPGINRLTLLSSVVGEQSGFFSRDYPFQHHISLLHVMSEGLISPYFR